MLGQGTDGVGNSQKISLRTCADSTKRGKVIKEKGIKFAEWSCPTTGVRRKKAWCGVRHSNFVAQDVGRLVHQDQLHISVLGGKKLLKVLY